MEDKEPGEAMRIDAESHTGPLPHKERPKPPPLVVAHQPDQQQSGSDGGSPVLPLQSPYALNGEEFWRTPRMERGSSHRDDHLVAELCEWLGDIGLASYAPHFLEEGYDDLALLASLTDKEVDDMFRHIGEQMKVLPGHRVKMKKHLDKLKLRGDLQSSAKFELKPVLEGIESVGDGTLVASRLAQQLQEWLECFHFEKYRSAFTATGYEDVWMISDLTDEQVSDMVTSLNEVTPIPSGHQVKLIKKIVALRRERGDRIVRHRSHSQLVASPLGDYHVDMESETGSTPSANLAIEGLASWLRKIGMSRYLTHFVDAGYDDVQMISRLNDQQVVEMMDHLSRRVEISPGHRAKLQNQMDKLRKARTSRYRHPVRSPRRRHSSAGKMEVDENAEVSKWLQRMGLAKYAEQFQILGYDDLHCIAEMDEKQVTEMLQFIDDEIGMPPGHRSKLTTQVKKLLQQMPVRRSLGREDGRKNIPLRVGSLPVMRAPTTSSGSLNLRTSSASYEGNRLQSPTSVAMWLRMIGLGNYVQAFRNVGLDDLSELAANPKLLEMVGALSVEEVELLRFELRNLTQLSHAASSSSVGTPGKEVTDLDQWLQEFGLGICAPYLTDAFGNLRGVAEAQEEQVRLALKIIGGSLGLSQAHQLRLRHQIQKLQQTYRREERAVASQLQNDDAKLSDEDGQPPPGNLFLWGFFNLDYEGGNKRRILKKFSNFRSVEHIPRGTCVAAVCTLNSVVALMEGGNVYTFGSAKLHPLVLGRSFGSLGPSEPGHVEDVSDIKALGGGDFHVSCIRNDHVVVTWGHNTNFTTRGRQGYTGGISGHLGHLMESGNAEIVPGIPLDVRLQQVACGGAHTVAVTAHGKVYTWGSNTEGQLGITEPGSTHTPQLVEGIDSPVVQVACGKHHTVALTDEGSVIAWGYNNFGQLGFTLPFSDYSRFPTMLSSIRKVVQVAAGDFHTAAIGDRGALYVWGNGEQGQLGLGRPLSSVATPTWLASMSGKGITSVACGAYATAVTTDMGDLYYWGFDLKSTPVLARGLGKHFVQRVALGHTHMVALDDQRLSGALDMFLSACTDKTPYNPQELKTGIGSLDTTQLRQLQAKAHRILYEQSALRRRILTKRRTFPLTKVSTNTLYLPRSAVMETIRFTVQNVGDVRVEYKFSSMTSFEYSVQFLPERGAIGKGGIVDISVVLTRKRERTPSFEPIRLMVVAELTGYSVHHGKFDEGGRYFFDVQIC